MMGIGHEVVFDAIVGDELDKSQLVFHPFEPDLLVNYKTLLFPT
jgi:hypothetical protein